MVANSPHYSPYFKSTCSSDHNIICFLAPPSSWCSKWHHYVTTEGHICPSSPLTRDGHICPSSPVRVNLSFENTFIVFDRHIWLVLKTRQVSLFKNNSCVLTKKIEHSFVLDITLYHYLSTAMLCFTSLGHITIGIRYLPYNTSTFSSPTHYRYENVKNIPTYSLYRCCLAEAPQY